VVDAEALAEALARGRPAAAVWPEDAASLARRRPALAAQPGVRPEPAFAPDACLDPLARRRAAAGVAARVLGGARPPHLLVDPPCPRHVLWLVGRGWE
jgi:hypothetical protein